MPYFTKLALFSAGALIFIAGPSHAADIKPYVNLGMGLIDNETREDFNGTLSGVFRGGIEFSRYFALEGEGQIGLGTKKRNEIYSDVRYDENVSKLDHQFGGYVVVKLPVSDAVSLHARSGFAAYKSSYTVDAFFEGERVGTFTGDYSYGGVSLGLGGQYMFGASRLNGIRLDSFMLIDVDNAPDVDSGLPDINGTPGFSVTYVRKF